MERLTYNFDENRQFRLGIEIEDINHFTEVALIRPPFSISEQTMQKVALRLAALQIIPILLPFADDTNPDIGNERIFPSDNIRQVGRFIFERTPGFVTSVLTPLERHMPYEMAENIARRTMLEPSFVGRSAVYESRSKLLIYDETEVFKPVDQADNWFNRSIESTKLQLEQAKWKMAPINTHKTALKGSLERTNSLDFLLSLFSGKDGNPHAIVATSFKHLFMNQWKRRYPDKPIMCHETNDDEALKCGCNIADLKNGTVLLTPPREQTFIVHTILETYAHPHIKILELPIDFIEGGSLYGGTRSQISSFSLR
jgi:hypothetical protein